MIVIFHSMGGQNHCDDGGGAHKGASGFEAPKP